MRMSVSGRWVPATGLSPCGGSSFLSYNHPGDGTAVIPILQMRGLRHRADGNLSEIAPWVPTQALRVVSPPAAPRPQPGAQAAGVPGAGGDRLLGPSLMPPSGPLPVPTACPTIPGLEVLHESSAGRALASSGHALPSVCPSQGAHALWWLGVSTGPSAASVLFSPALQSRAGTWTIPLGSEMNQAWPGLCRAHRGCRRGSGDTSGHRDHELSWRRGTQAGLGGQSRVQRGREGWGQSAPERPTSPLSCWNSKRHRGDIVPNVQRTRKTGARVRGGVTFGGSKVKGKVGQRRTERTPGVGPCRGRGRSAQGLGGQAGVGRR